MKIDEPNTPFERSVLEDEENPEHQEPHDPPTQKINLENTTSTTKKSYDYEVPVQNTNVCPDELESKLAHVSKRQQTRRVSTSSANDDDESDEDAHLTAEEVVKK